MASQRGQAPRAHTALSEAIVAAELADLPHCAASARLRLARLAPDSAGAAPLDPGHAWFEAQQIRNPTRMLDVWAPGF